jgi:hypothetical protein
MAKLWKSGFSYERGRQFLLFLFCLFLALIIWTLHKLSLEQTVYLQYKLHIHTNLPGREADAFSVEPLVVKGEATGFYALGKKYKSGPEEITVFINSKILKKSDKSDELFFLRSGEINNEVADVLSGNVRNVQITNDTLKFEFQRRSTRKAVVTAVINNRVIRDSSKYKVILTPEFVTISGSYQQTAVIDTVFTENIELTGIAQPKNGVIKLRPYYGIKYSDNEVYYSVKEVKK